MFNITAKEGRKRSISALVAVGNGNGAAGESKHTHFVNHGSLKAKWLVSGNGWE